MRIEHAGERALYPLAIAEAAGRPLDSLCVQPEQGQPRAQLGRVGRGVRCLHRIEGAALAGQCQQLLVQQRQRCMPLHFAGARIHLAGQHAQQGGLAAAVVTDHRNALATADVQLQRCAAAMRQHQVVGLQQPRAATLAFAGEQCKFGCRLHGGSGTAQLLGAGLQAVGLDLLRTALGGLGTLLLPAQQDRRLVGLLRIAIAARLPLLLAYVLFACAALLLAVLGARIIKLGGCGIALGGTGLGVVLPRPAIAVQPARIQFRDLMHMAQQIAVVADHQQPARPLLQLLVQLLAVARVQMVAGFVEDEPVGAAGPCAGQCNAHGLATTETRGRLRGLQIIGQAEGTPLLLQALAQVPAITDAGEVGLVDTAGFDARERGQFSADAGQLAHGAAWRVAGRGQQEHPTAAAHLAAVGRQLTGQQAREHALAGAIGTDQAGGHRFKGKRESGKQRSAIGQPIGHAIEREGMRGHATSMGCLVLPCAQGREESGRLVERRRHHWRIGREPLGGMRGDYSAGG